MKLRMKFEVGFIGRSPNRKAEGGKVVADGERIEISMGAFQHASELFTPMDGNIRMSTSNPEIAKLFDLNQSFYVDITPAE